ncbi:MAG: ATP-binding cassette domain-containing protein, partial [Candidatus Methanomethylophilaceae archaeon]
MLRVENLEFSYETKKILEDISFEAEGNSVVSLLGPNGVGKTTLLKCICNIHRPQRGVV